MTSHQNVYRGFVDPIDIKTLRMDLGLSREHVARFLGVSGATVVRWEADDAVSEPKGLQAMLLRAIKNATDQQGPARVARLVRSCDVSHMSALRELLAETDG